MGGAPSQILPLGHLDRWKREHVAPPPAIWLGGADVLDKSEFFYSNQISWVLSLGPSGPSDSIKLAGRKHIRIDDVSGANLGQYFKEIVLFISEGRHIHGHNVYIHCQAGISRSTTSLCAYLMAHLGLSFHECLQYCTLRRRAVCPNEGFRAQLREYERSRLRGTLAEMMRTQCAWYEDIRTQDMNDIRRALENDTCDAVDEAAGIEVLAQRNAKEAVDKALAAPKTTGLRLSRRSVRDGIGLRWLVNEGVEHPS